MALAEPVEIRPAMIAYIKAKQAEFTARSALSDGITRDGIRWYQVDRLAVVPREIAPGPPWPVRVLTT